MKTNKKILLILVCITISYLVPCNISCASDTKPIRITIPKDEQDIYLDFNNSQHNDNVKNQSGNIRNQSEKPADINIERYDPELEGSNFTETLSQDNTANMDRVKKSKQLNEQIISKSYEEKNRLVTKYKFQEDEIYQIAISTNMLTDFKLEEDEKLLGDIALSDQEIISIDPLLSIEHNKEIIHLLLRAKEPDKKITIIIPTNKRTYYFSATTTEKDTSFLITFTYDGKKNYNLQTGSGTFSLNQLKNLNFDYIISGNNDIKPVAVFSDKKSTYLQFSKKFYTTDLNPALYLEDENGLSIINYTIRGNLYIVDFTLSLSEKFVLISGKKKTYIERERYI